MPSVNKTPTIGLNKWEGHEYFKRQDFVDDNVIIDNKIKEIIDKIGDLNNLSTTNKTNLVEALNELKSSLSKIDLSASKVTIEDINNLFTTLNVEEALKEVMTKANENKTSILSLQEELGVNKATLQNNINAIREVL